MSERTEKYYIKNVATFYIIGVSFSLLGLLSLLMMRFVGLIFLVSGLINLYTATQAKKVPLLTIEEDHLLWTPSPLRGPTYIDREDFSSITRGNAGWLKGGDALTITWSGGNDIVIPVKALGEEHVSQIMQRLDAWSEPAR